MELCTSYQWSVVRTSLFQTQRKLSLPLLQSIFVYYQIASYCLGAGFFKGGGKRFKGGGISRRQQSIREELG